MNSYKMLFPASNSRASDKLERFRIKLKIMLILKQPSLVRGESKDALCKYSNSHS
jgi:hypothetical protein